MEIGDIVNVEISLATSQASGIAFGRALIMAYEGYKAAGTAQIYQAGSWASEMVADGYATSDATYNAVAALFTQPVPPSDVMVGQFVSSAVQVVDTAYPTVGDVVYEVSINGNAASVDNTGGGITTKTGLSSALKTQIDLLNQPVVTALVGSSPNQTLSITSETPGLAFTYSTTTSGSNLTLTQATANQGPVPQLIAFLAAGHNAWYMLLSSVPLDSDSLQIAAWNESQTTKRFFLAETSTAACYNPSSTTDVMYLVQALGYTHTTVMFNAINAAGTDAAAWVGYNLAALPGAANWAFSQLVGQLPDVLTDAQTAAILAKNGNYFVNVASVNITYKSNTGNGAYIDTAIGLDWFANAVQIAVYNLFTSQAAAKSKVNFDDGGISQVVTTIKGVAQVAIKVNKVFQSFSMPQPLASSFSSAVKQTRILPSLNFGAELAGALAGVQVIGTVTF